MSTVVYSCPFVPPEWIAAHDLTPRRILPRAAEAATLAGGATQGLCSWVQAVVTRFLDEPAADGVVLTTTCDQMRRAAELLDGVPLFLMNVPSTWQTAAAQKLYLNELERLGRFLCRLGGTPPGEERLVETMLEFDAARQQLRASRGHLSARAFSTAIARFHSNPPGDLPAAGEPVLPRGVEVALVGGPLMEHLFDIFDVVGEGGGAVVLDGTTTGERTLPVPFDRRELRCDPLRVLADTYFGTIPDAFRRPNSALYSWLQDRIKKRGVRGILFLRHTWCDTWAAEATRMKEWCGIPLLVLDAGSGSTLEERTISRVQTFLEVLR
ncbi:MAG: 2-hydroxyacyl-CoA dehydratase [Planctomycetota bacterium]|jgi:benzoyl-CoA reductase/2-hydroxyglutaryl-CoA dehydratase subunit BcrC/BadD/HgdB